MKILVCISQVPDTTTKVTFTDNNTRFQSQGVQFIINPYDENALSKALEIAEKNNGSVTAICVGMADTDASIRKALAIGANDAVRINANPSDAVFVAAQIAAYAKDKGFDLILCGRESIDYNGGMTGGLVAEMLNLPYINCVYQMELNGSTVVAERDIDGGKEKLQANLPMIISATKDLAEPRIPNMRGIMAARTKPLTVVEPIGMNSHSHFSSFDMPAAKAGIRMIDAENAADLIRILHEESKVI